MCINFENSIQNIRGTFLICSFFFYNFRYFLFIAFRTGQIKWFSLQLVCGLSRSNERTPTCRVILRNYLEGKVLLILAASQMVGGVQMNSKFYNHFYSLRFISGLVNKRFKTWLSVKKESRNLSLLSNFRNFSKIKLILEYLLSFLINLIFSEKICLNECNWRHNLQKSFVAVVSKRTTTSRRLKFRTQRGILINPNNLFRHTDRCKII